MDRSLFINRELSWLEFNARVLDEAFDERNRLLERLKFLSIFSTNLDEFYMVRVAGLRRQVATGVHHLPPDGLSPAEQLAAIKTRVAELLRMQQTCLYDQILPALAERGVRLVGMDELDSREWQRVDNFFESQAFPVLTPLAVDPSHPFPYISNLSLSLAVEIIDPSTGSARFARVKVPKSLDRWVSFGRPNHFIPLEQVIGGNLGALFPGMDVKGFSAFRVTRYSDLELAHSDDKDDLLTVIEEQVFQRRFAEVVRIEVESGMPESMRHLIVAELSADHPPEIPPLGDDDVVETGRLVDQGDLMTLATLDIPELRDPPLVPVIPPELRDPSQSIFDVLKQRDVLVHHPFDSFAATVEHFISSAATDDNVLAIKMTLYRTSGDTAIVRALTEAAERGKQVAVLIELQARFDEANNITWARTLESFGVHVAYGLAGLKMHAKTTLVVRREAEGIRRYVHIGSGNYNSKTGRLYTDIGLFSASPLYGADLSDLFNALTGFSRQTLYRKLVVAPSNMKKRFLEMIERESMHVREGREGRIIAKMNSLADGEVIEALYSASQAGVEIDLIIRGICCLRPGIPGVSDRIRVISIIGRFLEHSRIFYFKNGGEDEYYFGSADWMPRNLDRRVELIAPLEEKDMQTKLCSLFELCLADNRQAWELSADGTYTRRQPGDRPEIATHKLLLLNSWGVGLPTVTQGAETSALS